MLASPGSSRCRTSSGSFTIAEFTYVAVYAIALFGLNILTGITGQISLGPGRDSWLIGAYTTAILSSHHGWPQLLTVPVAGLVAGIAGFLFGFPALRLSACTSRWPRSRSP